jgi:WD40 repeat protein
VALGGLAAGWHRTRIANAKLRQQRYADLVNLAFEAWDVGDLARFDSVLAELQELDAGNEFELRYLHQCRRNSQPLKTIPLDHLVNSISASRFGARAIGLNDGSILYQGSPSGPLQHLLPGNRSVAGGKESRHRSSVQFTADGTHLLVVAAGGEVDAEGRAPSEEIQIWHCAKQIKCVGRIPHESAIFGLAVSANGQLGASGCYDGSFKVWSIPHGEVEWSQSSAHSAAIQSVAFMPSGDVFSTGGRDGSVHTWSLNGQKRLYTTATNGIQEIAYSPDGKELAIADDVEIRLWTHSSEGLTPTPKSIPGRAWDLAFSPKGDLLAFASPDHTLVVYDVVNWRQVKRYNHPHAVQSVTFCSSEPQLLSGCMDKQLRVWPTDRDHVTTQCAKHFIPALAVDSRGVVATSRSDHCVWLWDPQSDAARQLYEHPDRVKSVAFANDGVRIASCSDDGTVILYHNAEKKELLRRTYSFCGSVAFSPDSRWLACGGHGAVYLHDLVHHTEKSIASKDDYVMSISFSGEHLATSGGVWWSHGTTRLWKWNDGNPLLVKSFYHPNVSYPAVFSPDGKLLAMPHGLVSGIVRVQDVDSLELRYELIAHRMQTTSLAFSPDGSRLLTASADQTMKIWNATTGQRLGALKAQEQIRSLRFAPDGNSVMTASNEGVVRVWRAR